MERGPLRSARSLDGGMTWQYAGNPADDGDNGDHGFIALAAASNGDFHAIWIDKRNGKHKGLYAARYHSADNEWLANRTVDDHTCMCCWNVMEADDQGRLFALYRDINPRDMAMAMSGDNGNTWSQKGPVGDFDWDFQGCPHVGGSLAIEKESGRFARLHALVWTGEEHSMGIHYLRGKDTPGTWFRPLHLESGNARNPALGGNAKQGWFAAWNAWENERWVIRCARIRHAGTGSNSPSVISRKTLPDLPGNHQYPFMVSTNNSTHLFWSHQMGDSTVCRHASF